MTLSFDIVEIVVKRYYSLFAFFIREITDVNTGYKWTVNSRYCFDSTLKQKRRVLSDRVAPVVIFRPHNLLCRGGKLSPVLRVSQILPNLHNLHPF